MPVTSTCPPETGSLLGLMSAVMTTARAGAVAAVLVATRPKTAHVTVARTATSLLHSSCRPSAPTKRGSN